MLSIKKFFRSKLIILTILKIVFLAFPAWGEPSHGIAMYGEPQLLHDFVSLPYVKDSLMLQLGTIGPFGLG